MVWSLKSIPNLTDEQFVNWSRLLEQRAGIYLSEQQKTFLQTQVTMRMRELEYDDFGAYYEHVLDGVSGMLEWSRLIDRLVVNETRFFRHPASVEFIGRRLLEHLGRPDGGKHFDLWSVGCSSGEEPYSLAMVLNDVYAMSGLQPLYAITGTDISRAALSLARSGIYNERKVSSVEEKYRSRYFERVSDGTAYQVVSTLRDRICFNQGNVLNISEMPDIKVDAIFCQNLLVYFRRSLREQILNALVARLKPGGVLVIGLGEVVDWHHPDIKRLTVEAVQAYERK